MTLAQARRPTRAGPTKGRALASLYAGCGGLDLGFARAGFELRWANDVDPVAVETHRALLGDHAVAGSIAEVEWPAPGSVDVVVGGPPCQGFSVAGKMDPSDQRSRHVWTFLDFVDHIRPKAFVMENVKALAVSERWALVRDGLRARATAMGYDTQPHLLNAVEHGVPQRRERMFLIGVLDGEPPHAIPAAAARQATVRDALAMLPAFGEPGNDTLCVARITPAKRPVMRPTAHRGSLLFNGNGRPLRLDAPAPTLPASMGGNATPIVDQREVETGEESWVAWYHRRLLAGGSPLKRVPPHIRRITVEEAAALQTFPTGMAWRGTVSARYRQIGNAVPPQLAKDVADALQAALGAAQRRAAPIAAVA